MARQTLAKVLILVPASTWAVFVDMYTGHITADYLPNPNVTELAGIPIIWTPGLLFLLVVGFVLFGRQLTQPIRAANSGNADSEEQ